MPLPATRRLLVTADDFGIGPETSRGILELALRGTVTSTVLLVNSPFAEDGVAAWRKAGCPLELGWHPCLTLDSPVLPAERVPSLVGPDGRFSTLGQLLKRLLRGRRIHRHRLVIGGICAKAAGVFIAILELETQGEPDSPVAGNTLARSGQ